MTAALRLTIADPEAMAALGARLAAGLRALAADEGCVVHLQGELGVGKTTLVRGVLRALGHAGRVKSPTYTLLEGYPVAAAGERSLQHLDLYRLAAPEEVRGLALRDLPAADWLWIEWPEKGVGELPAADLVLRLAHAGSGREVALEPLTPVGQRLVDNLGV